MNYYYHPNTNGHLEHVIQTNEELETVTTRNKRIANVKGYISNNNKIKFAVYGKSKYKQISKKEYDEWVFLNGL